VLALHKLAQNVDLAEQQGKADVLPPGHFGYLFGQVADSHPVMVGEASGIRVFIGQFGMVQNPRELD
jgi:hypothetical protein